ncbi:fluoride efflux transporter CrcB [Clostridium niameyense]|uniref:fluoride efflux transporter CrcB n=1 Tax=Clostridium niameyense TaxID=1622073 RepID=UPI00067F0602|nr:fluoride efflux transporter CrcB [Clostridium niameyense]
MQRLFYVGIGGFLGASLRYLITINFQKFFGTQFPYGTLIVNILGGLFFGLIMEINSTTTLISPDLRLFLTTGIMGGLTTFSTFSYETVSFFTSRNYTLACLNTCLNLFLSFLGIILGKSILHIR